MTPADLTAEAERLLALGVPFVHQGRNLNGMDCAGFILALCRFAGLEIREAPAAYGTGPQAAMLEIITNRLEPAGAAAEGAIVAIRWPLHPFVSHVAYCTGRDLIHSYRSAGGITRHRYGQPWLRMTESLWWIPTVSHE